MEDGAAVAIWVRSAVLFARVAFFAPAASFDINYHRSPSRDKGHSVLNRQEVEPCIHEWASQGKTRGKGAGPADYTNKPQGAKGWLN